MTDFDYRRYSLNNLENWLHDAMSAGEATPQEIYDVIIGVVKENYECYKKQADQAYELLNLLNANPFSEEVKALGELWNKEEVLKEREYYEGSDSITFCDSYSTTPECMNSWSDFWNDDRLDVLGTYTSKNDNIDFTHVTEDGDIYTNKSSKVDGYSVGGISHSEYWYDYDRNDPNRKNPFEDKVVKWRLPVEIDGVSGEYYFTLPEDLLEQTGWKENDSLHWVDNGDGSFSLQKVEKSEETKL